MEKKKNGLKLRVSLNATEEVAETRTVWGFGYVLRKLISNHSERRQR